MIEPRWLVTKTPIPYMDGACWQERVLQYREGAFPCPVLNDFFGLWSEWQDVPVESGK